jgi:acetyl-CoA/propionyl-CoA carboxylase, biotin carboxylase, biotin carboxyl carrier protein
VSNGDAVSAGDLIVVLEAMKMENPVIAHQAGTVTALTVQPGSPVAHGALLCTITP